MADPGKKNEPREETPEERMARLRERAIEADSSDRGLQFVRWLRKRLPGDERFGDPLSTAGEKPVHQVARQVSALQPERPSVTHELGMTAMQLWQTLSEKQGRGRGDTDVALLFTDLVEFSSWALEAGDTAAVELLRDVGVAVESAIQEHRGVIVKRLGDGLMAAFTHPQEAVEAALEAQARLGEVEVGGHRPQMRAGVHWGRPRKLGSDYLGVDVNVAARIGAAAGPMELLVSERVAEQLDRQRVSVGRAKKLRASGAPEEFRVRTVKRKG